MDNMAFSMRQLCRLCAKSTTQSIFCSRISRYSVRNSGSIASRGIFDLSRTSRQPFSTSAKASKTVAITFVDRDDDKTTVQAKVGDTLLDVAKDNDIDLEGACEGTLACSTCHLVFDPEQYKKIKLEPPSEEELDMLDLAYGLTDTSRLGCQIEVTEEMDGLVLKVPVSVDARNS